MSDSVPLSVATFNNIKEPLHNFLSDLRGSFPPEIKTWDIADNGEDSIQFVVWRNHKMWLEVRLAVVDFGTTIDDGEENDFYYNKRGDIRLYLIEGSNAPDFEPRLIELQDILCWLDYTDTRSWSVRLQRILDSQEAIQDAIFAWLDGRA